VVEANREWEFTRKGGCGGDKTKTRHGKVTKEKHRKESKKGKHHHHHETRGGFGKNQAKPKGTAKLKGF